ncbi:MAG: 16S rRNA (adenine(1518)-N(6)/adenine(1519)-N(6))-dimethyltransferase RsmA [Pseudomonadota bacterium]
MNHPKIILNSLNKFSSKSLGQNFLINTDIAKRIVNFADITEFDAVLEIGPGLGMLTSHICRQAETCFAIEKDDILYEHLIIAFSEFDNFEIINKDILIFKLEDKFEKKLKLISNLPYNISSQVIFWILNYRDQLETCIITIQKELADRLLSKEGSKDFSPIGILLSLFYDIKKCMDLKGQSFFPAPRVISTVLKLTRNDNIFDDLYYKAFSGFLKLCFQNRRKTLINNLSKSKYDKNDILYFLNENILSEKVRAEELSSDILRKLFNEIK